ncbi:MAG: DMT family transporter [Clostridiales Family XIII bacterium]|jgi:drug/metabolite transporter (DMT)-like permease|nr:DMT family transporter [Clostridiales Family XIII bacterium]
MALLVCIWGLEYIFAKQALETFSPLSLVFFKYLVGFFVLAAVKLAVDRRIAIRKRELPALALCALFGDLIYYYCEYQSLEYIPVALVTIILSLVPLLSMIIEGVAFNRRPNLPMILGALACMAGVALVIGVDVGELRGDSGKAIGCALAGAAVVAWNIYNFLTERLSERYSSLDLTIYQLVCTLLMLVPYILANMPAAEDFTAGAVGGTLYLGVFGAAIGFFIYVKSISVLGATPCALYSNFLPVSAAAFGWIFLGETLSALQILGGAVVIASACMVIAQKNRLTSRANAG